ncbi:MAG: ATP-binding protein [Gammaproteobacteria bacterium]|nr:ATP-binding protein [Gammaproteobacteria bacterium]
MIRRLQALNYRCLRYADVSLGRFQVLVGPNASGKSTLCDIVAFLSDLVSDGLDAAVEKRTRNFQDLVWERPGEKLGFELALEFDVPSKVKKLLPQEQNFAVFRYEIAIKENREGVHIASERGLLMPAPEKTQPRQAELFPSPPEAPETILTGGGQRGSRTILSKSRKGKDNFSVEVSQRSGRGWLVSISFGPHRSALGNLPESLEKLPMATHVKRTLTSRVKFMFLDSSEMRKPSPPIKRSGGLGADGSGLPWAIKQLQKKNKKDYEEWLAHVQTTLPDLASIRVVERPEDLHAYLRLRYKTGVEIPSWTASDGTLRFLALTLLAYLPASDEVYILEEPENGVHPLALDAIYDSLSSLYDSQVLVATHSPAFLKLAKPEETLCLAKNEEGATDILHGNEHPSLRDWQESVVDMELLFAAGVIG